MNDRIFKPMMAGLGCSSLLVLGSIFSGCVPAQPPPPPPPTPQVYDNGTNYTDAEMLPSGVTYVTGRDFVDTPAGGFRTSVVTTRKYDSQQNMIWERKFPDITAPGYLAAMAVLPTYSNQGNAIRVADDGSVYIAATVQKKSNEGLLETQDYDGTLIKYSADGELRWEKRIDFGKNDAALDLVLDTEGNIYVNAYLDTDAYYDSSELIAFDSEGNRLWQKSFGKNSSIYTMQTQTDGILFSVTAGGIPLGGEHGSTNGTPSSCRIAKADFAGNVTNLSVPDTSTGACKENYILTNERLVHMNSRQARSLPLADLGSAGIAWNWLDIYSFENPNSFKTQHNLSHTDRLNPSRFFSILNDIYSDVDEQGNARQGEKIVLAVVNAEGQTQAVLPLYDGDKYNVHDNVIIDFRMAQLHTGELLISMDAYDGSNFAAPLDARLFVVDTGNLTVSTRVLGPRIGISDIVGTEEGQTPVLIGQLRQPGKWYRAETPLIIRAME